MYDKELVKFVKTYLIENLGHFVELRLFGSRARGDNLENSDYDFYLILDDDAPKSWQTGRGDHMPIVTKLNLEVDKQKFDVSKIDLLISRKSEFEKMSGDEVTLAYRAKVEGIIL